MLVRDGKLGQSLAAALGDKAVALMRGHGNVVVGPNVRVATARAPSEKAELGRAGGHVFDRRHRELDRPMESRATSSTLRDHATGVGEADL
jgi:hypothetical protein